MRPVLLLACLILCGCSAKHVITVPMGTCGHVNIRSFTQPCSSIPGKPGFMSCDKVLVKVDCVKVVQ